jgi:hypothetical protein
MAEYALGVLTEAERAEVERHLDTCDECRREARELREAAATLPLALDAASPKRLPPFLKARVLAAVRPAPARRPLWPRVATGVAAFALVTGAAAVVWGLEQRDRLDDERALVARLARQVGQQELVLDVVDADNTRRVLLRPTRGGSRAYGKLFTRPDVPYAVVMVARLPQPKAGRRYHVWAEHDGRMEPIGVINVNDDGFGVLVVKTDNASFDAVRVVDKPDWPARVAGNPVLEG